MTEAAVHAKASLFSGDDIHLFREGTHARLYQRLGCHLDPSWPGDGGRADARFAVWAPNARAVEVVGDFNGWAHGHPLQARLDDSGIWEGCVPGVARGDAYKYRIHRADGHVIDKADPFAFFCEQAPATASRAWRFEYAWTDAEWMAGRAARQTADAPVSIYEVHLGSWLRPHAGTLPTYRDIAGRLADYVRDMGFTHVELMPLAEHPYYGSWGYQCTGYFAPTSRYGTPEDFMFLIDTLHRAGIAVVLDWVPSHFPTDAHGLATFDGTHLYEHVDPRQGFHPEWHSCIFNYGRHEVSAFLLSSALFWLDRYHIDALRVDAVASMLYLDYGRRDGEWVANRYGGRENLEAVAFLRRLNEAVCRDQPDTLTFAEESTAWPMVSRPVHLGGLGFSEKWNMGWMHDTLAYLQHDPIHRRFHHGRITFSIWYAFQENFLLPLSHDEVVHGKGSLLARMPGDAWQRFAGLRGLFGYMWAHPGKKLLFMGGEFGQWREWAHEGQLDWHLLDDERHAGLRRWVADLNHHYRHCAPLHELDFDAAGFEWLIADDADNSVLAFLRRSRDGRCVLVVCNFTPVRREHYGVGVPQGGDWRELLNSDAGIYGGGGAGNFGRASAGPLPMHGQPWSLSLTLPPLAVLWLIPEDGHESAA